MRRRLKCFYVIAALFVAAVSAASAKTVMVIAPHPDDEALITAGIIEAALNRGDTVKVVVVTNGDVSGVNSGLSREAESISAMSYLGLPASSVIFLGYGDQALMHMYQSASPTDIYTSVAGQVATYANKGLGNTDYHNYLYQTHGPYNRVTLVGDIQAVLNNFRPDDIYTTCAYDEHPDHRATLLLVAEALLNIRKQGGANPYSPKLHYTLIHFGSWPGGSFDPTNPFPKPANLDSSSPLEWPLIESVTVPADMQLSTQSSNRKYGAISRYPSQMGSFNLSFIHSNEFFWVNDYSGNLALFATATASSETAVYGQTAAKAIDGVVGGDPESSASEWVSDGQRAGAWIRLTWPNAVTISEVVLHDRPNLNDNVTSGTLQFSDNTSVPVGALPNNGNGLHITFSDRTVTWLQFRVDSATRSNTGLSEIEVPGSGTAPPPPPPPPPPPTPANIASQATVSVSSEDTSTNQLGIKAVDGVIDGYPGDYTKEWATVRQLAGAWIKLTWPAPMMLSEMVLYDRPNRTDNILAGTLLFSDNSTAAIGALPADGSAQHVALDSKMTTSVQLRIDSAVGSNIGLAEIEVMGIPAASLAGIQCTPSTVAWGGNSTCTVTLLSAAPTGGVTVELSSSLGALTVPTSVTIGAGATSASFTASAGAVSTAQTGTITATLNGGSFSSSVNITAAALSSFQCNPASLASGDSSTCTVVLNGTGGAAVTLSSNLAVLTVPASVVVAAGASSATFSATAGTVSAEQAGAITASLNGGSLSANLTVTPALPGISSLVCSPSSILSGGASTCTVTMTNTSGATVSLSSSNTNAVTVPTSVAVPAGSGSATFTASARKVSYTRSATITAAFGSSRTTASITVTTTTIKPSDLQCSPASVNSGETSTCTVTLTAAVGAATAVSLASNLSALTVPVSVTVPVAASTATFSATAGNVTNNQTATITATLNSSSHTASLTLVAPPATLSSLQCSPATLASGGTSTCTVTLTGAASTATAVGLSSNLEALTVPASVTVASGASATMFSATAGTVAADQTGSITATLNSVSRTANVTVTAPAPSLSSLQCSPATVASGGTSTCTITLTGVASSATSVGLSSNLEALTVPGSVTVASGASAAMFSATAGTVTADQTGSITATLNSVSRTASVTITAPAPSLSSLLCSPAIVASGGASTCTVTLTRAASAATAVGLSSNLAALTVPASVTVASGASTATFNAAAGTVTADQTGTITATLDSVSRTFGITITAPAPAPSLSSLQCSPATVASGGTSTCSVTLTGAANAAMAVGLSSNLAALTVPASVTVASGASTATFSATAGTVTADQTGTITATLDGASRSAGITVTTVVPPTISNIAPLAAVTVSSENPSLGQLGIKAVDGVINGCPYACSYEWVTALQNTGWIRLTWSAPATISQVVLYDRFNTKENILAGTLTFSDGSSMAVGTLPMSGSAAALNFAPKAVTWVQFTINSAYGKSTGLAEFQAMGTISQ